MLRTPLRRLVLAMAIEAILIPFALMGGPHGTLGVIPWLLQLPGMLFILFFPGYESLQLRIAALLLTQIALWFGVLTLVARWRARRR